MNALIEKYREEKRWVNYKLPDKIPLSPSGYNAMSNNPSTWGTYDQMKVISDKVGIIFTPDECLLGIDIDHCLEDGKIVHDKKEIIEKFLAEANTYTEFSPSKTGTHSYLALTEGLPLIRNKKPPFEVYTSGRFFTVTGNIYGEEKAVRQVTPEEALRLLSIIGYPWERQDDGSASGFEKQEKRMEIEDGELLEKMFAAKNGNKIKALYSGDISEYADDDSSADMAFCMHLAFWTGKNVSQMERIWLASPLGSREKTQERKNYRDRTIGNAIRKCGESYGMANISAPQDVNDFKETYKKDVAGAKHAIAKYLSQKYNVKTIGEAKREMYYYKNGVYIPAEIFLKAEIQNILEELVTINCKKEIISKIQDLTISKRQEFDSGMDRNMINLRNGVLNIETLELYPHDPKYLFFYRFPVTYNPVADCPKTKAFLSEILKEEDINVIQEWAGFCLYRKYFIKKAMIFVGEPNTGKTTLLNVLRKLLGDDNVSGVSLQRIASDKFSSAHLYGKHVNIYDDLSFKDVNDNGAFKIATGGGLITGEFKFGNQFNFENYSKITFSANKIPNVKDVNDDAYFSRWIIIQFNNQPKFENKFLAEEISTEEELSGMLNFALVGLRRLLSKKMFSYEKTVEEIKDEMLRSGSPLANFAYDCIEECPQNWISKEEMYDAYARFIKSEGFPLMTLIDFGRKLTKYANYVLDGKKEGKTGWRNVKIKGTPDINSIPEKEIGDDPLADW